jgi:hypothetical protein
VVFRPEGRTEIKVGRYNAAGHKTKLHDHGGSNVIRDCLIKSQAAMQNVIAVTSYRLYSTVCYAANKNVRISFKNYYYSKVIKENGLVGLIARMRMYDTLTPYSEISFQSGRVS